MDKLQKGVMFSKTEAYNEISKLYRKLPDYPGVEIANEFLMNVYAIINCTDDNIDILKRKYGVNNG